MQKNLRVQNRKINYWIEGGGQPVMLVHGFAEDHRVWDYQVEHLRKNFQLVIPDLPGSGISELLEETTMESMAEVIKAILDNESIQICTIVGHSMGGYITLAFAEKYATRLNSFGLFHSTAYPDNEEKKQTRLKAIEFMKKNGVPEFLKTSTPNLFAKEEGIEKGKQKMINKVIDDYKSIEVRSLVAYYEAMMDRPDRTEVLKTFTKPILFVLGKYDTAVPYPQGIEQSRLPGKAEVHTLHHSGHMGMWEEMDTSNGILEGFFKTNVS